MVRSLLIFLIAVLFLPALAEAHSLIRDEQTVGGYRVEMTFFGDAAFSDENTRFTLLAYRGASTELIEIVSGKVRITTEAGDEVFAGDIETEEDTRLGKFMYRFEEKGNHILYYTLTTNRGVIPEVAFPLYVNNNPNNLISTPPQVATATMATSVPTSTPVQPKENKFLGIAGLLGFLGLLYFGYKHVTKGLN
jgi:hypothetical protein